MPTVTDEPLRLSSESPRTRWLILSLVWIVVAIVAIADSLAVRDYVKLLDDSVALPSTGLPLQRVIPSEFTDVEEWTRLALEHNGGWQVRYTMLDNAPYGREVHWNSGFVHLVQLSGWIRASFTGEPIAQATERSLAWFNLPIFLAVVAFFSAWVARRAGAAAGGLLALGMLGHRLFYEGFSPNNVDHHGLLSAATFGVVLGATFMYAGWSDEENSRAARGAAILSAICGGIGLWVSAASTIPAIALTGVGGAIAACLKSSVDERRSFDASLWRLWGRTGGAISLVTYLIEYAPAHIAMRLEVNHPLYAIAWVAGGELIAMLGEWRVRGTRPVIWKLIVALVAALAPAIAIAIGGSHVFLPLDPGLARVHASIDEFRSMGHFVRIIGFAFVTRYLLSFVLILPAAFVLQRNQPVRRPLVLASVVVVGLVAMGCVQMRWWQPADAAELALLLAGVAAVRRDVSQRATNVALGLLGAVFLQQAVWRAATTRFSVNMRAVTQADAMAPLFHDVAVTLRATQPTGDITLLASPDASMSIGYFGGFKTLGTFYWENRDGLAAAAHIFSAESDDDAYRTIQQRKVTHIATFSAVNFLVPFLDADRHTTSLDTLRKTFGARLLGAIDPPRWLKPIPFVMRAGGPATSVRLYQVVPDQTEFESLWATAIARAAAGDTSAESTFDRAIATHAASDHARLLAQGAREVYQWGAHALALRLYKRSAGLDENPQTTLAIAWLLSTSGDGAIRDGKLAVSLMEPIVRGMSDRPGVLDTYAAALAESGRFADAAKVQASAIDQATQRGDDAARERGQLRLAEYRAGRPWRQ